ncbi:lipase 1-like [Arctopsyche grandis]|uniref:lipase 1-like n=1 Tax=Arctopsyche grandis TaxID=121162 RepID=UPI00406D9154
MNNWHIIFYWLTITATRLATAQWTTSKIPREVYMKLPELAEQYGYSVRRYRVETPDGYTLTMFRMKGDRLDAEKLPVLLVHGLTGSAEDFVRMGPKRSLAFLMADAGYDVWLGNLRSTMYTSHIRLKKNDKKYWNFSYDEHGKYDVPTMMERILRETISPKLHYIGFSMGTTSYFVACHRRPDLAAKVASFTGLAPVTSASRLMKEIAQWSYDNNIVALLKNANVDPLSFPKDIPNLSDFCNSNDPNRDNCYTTISFLIVGEDYEQVDWNKTTTILARLQPITLKTLDHYRQMGKTGAFREYDWGKKENIKKYGYSAPKTYNISANIAPTTLFHGGNDLLSEPSGSARLSRKLKRSNPIVISKLLSHKKFNHLDFVYAKDIHKLLNYDILNMIEAMSKMRTTLDNKI